MGFRLEQTCIGLALLISRRSSASQASHPTHPHPSPGVLFPKWASDSGYCSKTNGLVAERRPCQYVDIHFSLSQWVVHASKTDGYIYGCVSGDRKQCSLTWSTLYKMKICLYFALLLLLPLTMAKGQKKYARFIYAHNIDEFPVRHRARNIYDTV